MKQLWDQLEGEPNASYARFLIYKNLGLDRSLEKAYQWYLLNTEAKKSNKKQQSLSLLIKPISVSGTWTNDSVNYQWKKRAELWDIDQLKQTEKKTLKKQIDLISNLTEQLEQIIKDGKLKPKNFFQLIQGLDVINRRYTPDLTRAVFCHVEAEDSPIREGAAGEDSTEENRETTEAD